MKEPSVSSSSASVAAPSASAPSCATPTPLDAALRRIASRLARERLLMGVALAVLALYALIALVGPILNAFDTYTTFARLDVWTAALRAGEPLATWTPIDANGFGSPMPFFYHKLANLVATVFTLASGDIVMGFRLALLAFSAVMFYGYYQCAARLGANRTSRTLVATAGMLAPYAIDNAIARGALAEYAAMALMPLVLALALDFVMQRARARHGFALFAMMGLLALAHSLIFVIAAALLMLLAGWCAVTRTRGRWTFAIALAAALVAFGVFMYVPFTYWAQYFCPQQAHLFGRPADNVMPVSTVFSPMPEFRSGWIAPLLTATTLLQLARLRELKRPVARLAFTLGVVALVLIVLLTPIARPLWALSAQLDFIQFPWRLLALSTPIAILAIAGAIESLPCATRRLALLGFVTLASLHAACLLFVYQRHFPPIALAELRHEAPSKGPGPDAGGEYFPAAYGPRLASLEGRSVSVLPARRPLISANGCTFAPIARPDYFKALRIEAWCADAGKLRVNQFATPFLDSVATDEQGTTQRPLAGRTFIEFELPAGHWIITVKPRSYLELVVMAWRARLTGQHGPAYRSTGN